MTKMAKFFKWITSIIVTLIITTFTVFAVDINLNDGDAITSVIWWSISDIMLKISLWDWWVWINITWNLKINQICASSVDTVTSEDLDLTDDKIDNTTWTELEDIMANFDIEDSKLSISSSWTLTVVWDVCWESSLWDEVCIPAWDPAKCFWL